MISYDMHIQISTSVLQEHTTAASMLFATISRDRTIVYVNLDIMEMQLLAKVYLALISVS